MAKQPKKPKRPAKEILPLKRKVSLGVEVNPQLKAQMEALAKEHDRTLTGEVARALKDYINKCAQELPPPK